MHTIALPLNRIEESSRQTILRGGVLHIDTDHAQDTALLICEALDALPPEVLCLAVGGCLNLQRAAVRATLDRLGSADGREDLDEARALLECTQDVVDGFPEVFPKMRGVDLGSPGGDKSMECIAHREGDKVTIDSVREIPAQDSGEALVGVACWVGDDDGKWSSVALPILGFDARFGYSRVTKNPESDPFMCWKHARPAVLGRPQ